MTAAPLIAELRIAPDHAAFDGHFPGFPILPGAALLDAALHEIACGRNLDLTGWRVANVKFLELVRPGDALTLEHSPTNETNIRFVIRNRDSVVSTGTLAMITARDGHDTRS